MSDRTFVEVLIDALVAQGRWCSNCGEEMLLSTADNSWECLLCGEEEELDGEVKV